MCLNLKAVKYIDSNKHNVIKKKTSHFIFIQVIGFKYPKNYQKLLKKILFTNNNVLKNAKNYLKIK